jgi:hypothetical protein
LAEVTGGVAQLSTLGDFAREFMEQFGDFA